jgi:methyl-accepting chemotaxis protein
MKTITHGQIRFTIGRKIYFLIGLSFLGLLGITFLDSGELASGLRQQKQIELQHLAELAIGIIKDEQAAAQKGDLSTAEAQKRAQARLATLRYGHNDYFFVTDIQNRMQMHPMSPQLNGQDVSDTKDPSGKRIFVEMTETVRRNGSGFVDYSW